jgi:hypothetical protein
MAPAGAPTDFDVPKLRQFFVSHDASMFFPAGPPSDADLQEMIDGNSSEELRELLVDEYGEAPEGLMPEA